MTFDQVRNGFIKEECDRAVDACFQCVERNDGGDHHGHYHFQGCAHEEGREDHIHYDHRQRLHDSTADQRNDCCFLCFIVFVNAAGNQHAKACGENMHDDADDATLGTDRKALNKGNNDSQQEACPRAIGEGADEDRDIRRVLFQESRRRDQRKMDRGNQHDRNCPQHRHRYQLSC